VLVICVSRKGTRLWIVHTLLVMLRKVTVSRTVVVVETGRSPRMVSKVRIASTRIVVRRTSFRVVNSCMHYSLLSSRVDRLFQLCQFGKLFQLLLRGFMLWFLRMALLVVLWQKVHF
jgi:hypothetical protein